MCSILSKHCWPFKGTNCVTFQRRELGKLFILRCFYDINQEIKKTKVFFRKRKTFDLEHTFLHGGVNERQASEAKREAALLKHKELDAKSQRSSERLRESKNKNDKKKKNKVRKQN